jgi:hypothetical protein
MTRLLISMTPQPHPLVLPGSTKRPPKKEIGGFGARVGKVAGNVARFFSTLGATLVLPYDKKSVLKSYKNQRATSKRAVSWTRTPLGVSELKDICKRIEGFLSLPL